MRLLGGAVAGIHSMVDEHFGICIVEYMAAGAIPIGWFLFCMVLKYFLIPNLLTVFLFFSANKSAGPKMDIVLPQDGKQTGFLAQDVQEYASAIIEIIKMSSAERLEMAAVARRRASLFSEQRFYDDFKAAVRPILFDRS